MLCVRIKYLREKHQMSQSELAAILNISPSTQGMYEQGRRFPSIETIVKMAGLFGVSLDYLVTGKEFNNEDSRFIDNEIAKKCPCRSCYWKEYMGK